MDDEEWATTLRSLNCADGPIQQLERTLQYISGKLSPSRVKATSVLKWTISNDDVQKACVVIERQKQILNVALANDNVKLSMMIRDQVDEVAKAIEVMRLEQKSQSELSHEQELATQAQVQSIRDNVDVVQKQQEREHRKTLLHALTSIDFRAMHSDTSSRRTQGTGKWFLDAIEFRNWKKTESSSVLWCPGIPGAGKTMLSSLVIDVLGNACGNETKTGAAGVYCSYRNRQSTLSILGSILQQLLHPLDVLPPSDISMGGLESALADVCLHYSHTYVVIDALDECGDGPDLLKALWKWQQNLHALHDKRALHIMITGRISVHADVVRFFDPFMELQILGKDQDVRAFLHQSLSDHDNLSQWILGHPDFENDIINAILNRLSGMFLLARLYIDLLASTTTMREVREALKALPEGIDDTYTDAWHRICAQRSHQARLGKNVLSWVVLAARPLRVNEIQHALAVVEGDEEFNPEGLPDSASLVTFCAGLVVIDTQSDQIRLVHPTTQEYFDHRKTSLFDMGHENIATSCITYLRMTPFRNEGACSEFDAFCQRCCAHPFLGYSVVNWGTHVKSSISKRVFDLALSLLNDERSRMAAWQGLSLNCLNALGAPRDDFAGQWPSMEENEKNGDWFNESKKPVGGLQLAAYFGLLEVTGSLLHAKKNPDETMGINITALHWAVMNGHNHIIKFLLEAGADPNRQQEEFRFRRWCFRNTMYRESRIHRLPLGMAATTNNFEATQLLIEHGARVNERIQEPRLGPTALNLALQLRYTAIVEILVANGADLNSFETFRMVHLLDLSVKTLQLFMNAGVKKRFLYETLNLAVHENDHTKLRWLLQHGVQVDSLGSRCDFDEYDMDDQRLATDKPIPEYVNPLTGCWTESRLSDLSKPLESPLVITIYQRSRYTYYWRINSWVSKGPECFFLLLNSGANIHIVCERAYDCAHDFVEIKLRNKPFIRRYTTPLFTASYYGHLDMVQELVKRGADVNQIFDDLGVRCTALTGAILSESFRGGPLWVKGTLQLLVEAGANVDLCESKHRQRIKELTSMSLEEVKTADVLCKAVVHPRAGFSCGASSRSFRDRRDALSLLLADGADPKLCCERDQVAIKELMSWSDEDIHYHDEEREARLARDVPTDFDLDH